MTAELMGLVDMNDPYQVIEVISGAPTSDRQVVLPAVIPHKPAPPRIEPDCEDAVYESADDERAMLQPG